jgi:hypothetical protein
VLDLVQLPGDGDARRAVRGQPSRRPRARCRQRRRGHACGGARSRASGAFARSRSSGVSTSDHAIAVEARGARTLAVVGERLERVLGHGGVAVHLARAVDAQ